MRLLTFVAVGLTLIISSIQIERLEDVLVYAVEPATITSRRSFSSKPVSLVDQPNNKISPWCSVAILCHRTYSPVCGYDDNFGYGKFDDICHMLQVNCYWKYNFALVPSCRPVI
ncbi:unnamed protein product, partial [Iphiclides podalirius]